MALTLGTRLGPYEILAPLGVGGMGEVYRARDTKLQRDVALKILPDTFANDPERLARFTREAHTLAALNHPHIAAIYGFEDSTAARALVMELVEGEDLAQRLARGPIPLAEALPIAAQIAEALQAAHERGVIHRDLKPANIKVRADGAVKVLDFGLAKALERGQGTTEPESGHSATLTSPVVMTSAGMLLGTAAYMSPEQARGQTVDVRTDLWAFGCVLFEMLSGTRAFPGDSVTDTLAAVVKEEPKWDSLPVQTPAAIHKLLRRGLTKDRKRRLASASDARLDIEDALTTDTEKSRQTSAAPRRSAFFFAVGLGIGLVAAVGAYGLAGRTVTGSSTAPTVTRLVIQAPAGTQIVSGHREVGVSADGHQVAFIASGAAEQHIYVRRLDELEPHRLAGTEGARDLTFSPDGRWLAFNAANKIRKVSLAGGFPVVVADSTHSHGLAWRAAEDAIYYTPAADAAIWKVPAGGGTATAVTTLDKGRGERSHESPLFSADGRTLLFTVNASYAEFDEAEVSLLTLETGARETVRTGGDAVALTNTQELIFVRARSLMSATYDANRHQLSSEPLQMIAGVRRAAGGATVSLADSGTLAYVPSPEVSRRSLVWIAPDGVEVDANFGRRYFRSAVLSRDGRRVAVSADFPQSSLYIGEATGGTLTPVSSPGADKLAWSPDGKWIAGSVHDQLVRISTAGGRSWSPLFGEETTNRAQEWTLDGRGLLFSRREVGTGRNGLRLLSLDSSPPRWAEILDSNQGFVASGASLSPDGRWLAYESNESGQSEIYIQSFPVAAGRLQVSRNGGTKATWAKNANRVYFLDGTTLMVSTVITNPELRADTPRAVVNVPQLVQDAPANRPYDVAPDGHILAIKEDDTVRSDHIVVVQNWLTEARARSSEARK